MLADGEPFLIDFGIASALDLVSVTDTGAVVGTPATWPPRSSKAATRVRPPTCSRFAATLAYAATGRPIYGLGPAPAVAYRVVHHEPDLSGVPSWLVPILRDALATDPAARPTAGQLLARLGAQRPVPARSVHREEETVELKAAAPPPETRSPSEIARARRADVVRRRWVIGTCAVVGLLAATGREHLPEASLLLLVVYGLALLIDAMFGLAAKAKGRVDPRPVGHRGLDRALVGAEHLLQHVHPAAGRGRACSSRWACWPCAADPPPRDTSRT